eukprot:TRINITY_DN9107_c1_g1_i2.p1 TRINITY_DN9107_c1_g1~~TRINITY_DN9107_c1_g1_i2.p1  ORF type:complete len:331 (+),score=55.23 TRINITY_DN9107_c1_g1_i2:127-1119(+)
MDLEEQEAHEEKPLLAGKGAKDNLSTRVSKKNEEKLITSKDFVQRMFIMIPGPVLVFAGFQLAIGRYFHYNPFSVLTSWFLICLAAFVWVIYSTRFPKQAWFGRAILMAACFGLLAGVRTYYQKTIYYFHYRDAPTYANAAASQPAGIFADAGALSFSTNTFVDVSKSVGYMSADEGVIVCVAPLIDSSMPPESEVNYYAWGINCCSFRSHFMCDDSADVTAKASLVKADVAGMRNPWIASWFATPPSDNSLEKAIAMQQAVFGGPEKRGMHLFVSWLKSPTDKMTQYLDEAIMDSIKDSLYFFLFMTSFTIWLTVGIKNIAKTLKSFVR